MRNTLGEQENGEEVMRKGASFKLAGGSADQRGSHVKTAGVNATSANSSRGEIPCGAGADVIYGSGI